MRAPKLHISFTDFKSVKLLTKNEYSLDSDEIIIYSIHFPDFMALLDDLIQYLNLSELDKAKRYYKDTDRNQFIIHRAILKVILSAYTKIDIKKIHLDYQFNKKPYLASHPWLFFNLSHSGDFAAIAISRKKVGLDIEQMSNEFVFSDLLPDVFDEEQVMQIKKDRNKQKTFYTFWTRKEAFVKALGKGIDKDFKSLPCLDGEHPLNSSYVKNKKNWQIYSFNFAKNYLGSLAIEDTKIKPSKLISFKIPNKMTEILKIIA